MSDPPELSLERSSLGLVVLRLDLELRELRVVPAVRPDGMAPCRRRRPSVLRVSLPLPGSGGGDARLSTSLTFKFLGGLPALSGVLGGVGSGERVGELAEVLMLRPPLPLVVLV